MIFVPLNETVPLRALASDGRTDLFGRARIYDAAGAVVTTLTMAHVAEGLYSVNWSSATEGFYSAVIQFFTDAGFTADAGYGKSGDTLEVNSVKSNIARILGLVHENSVIDQQVFDGSGNMTSARVRSYNSKANALAAGAGGLLNTWTVTASYTANLLNNYKLVKEP